LIGKRTNLCYSRKLDSYSTYDICMKQRFIKYGPP
jgi:hypothetical protein